MARRPKTVKLATNQRLRDYVQDPLAEALLKGGHGPGTTIRVVHKDGEFSFAAA